MIDKPAELLRSLFDEAVAAAQPSRFLAAGLPRPPQRGRTIVLGAGKGAAAMAAAFDAAWAPPCSGLVVTRDGYAQPAGRIEVVEAGHPTPDPRGVQAAQRILVLARSAGPDDLIVCLISGGASSLLPAPRPGISLDDKRGVTRELLARGATIGQLNTVRKHLSQIKGGQLALAAGSASVVALIVSDVVGDDIATIGSGLTAPDPTSCADAWAVLSAFDITPPPAAAKAWRTAEWETPKSLPATVENYVLASSRTALDAARAWARRAGLETIDLGDRFEGDVEAIARQHAEHVAKVRSSATKPVLLLSGGEATVVVRGNGKGGPNTEFALRLALELEAMAVKGVWALVADTDGTDGVGNQAGAIFDPELLSHARKIGCDPRRALSRSDSAGFFAAAGGLLVTGPTYTNVNDFRAILVSP